MRHLLVRKPWTRIRDVLGDKSNPYDTSDRLQQRDQETVYIPNPLIFETGELFYGQKHIRCRKFGRYRAVYWGRRAQAFTPCSVLFSSSPIFGDSLISLAIRTT